MSGEPFPTHGPVIDRFPVELINTEYDEPMILQRKTHRVTNEVQDGTMHHRLPVYLFTLLHPSFHLVPCLVCLVALSSANLNAQSERARYHIQQGLQLGKEGNWAKA